MKLLITETWSWKCGLVWGLKDWESARRGDHRLVGFHLGPLYFVTN